MTAATPARRLLLGSALALLGGALDPGVAVGAAFGQLELVQRGGPGDLLLGGQHRPGQPHPVRQRPAERPALRPRPLPPHPRHLCRPVRP